MKYHNYFEVPPVTPREAFQPIIDNYRSLKWLATGERSSFLPRWPYIEWPSSGKHPERAHQRYQADYDIWKAMRGLKDVYLDCGWNVHAVEQSSFQRNEFIERKKRYIEDVVAPLRKAKNRSQAGYDRQDAAEKAVEEISGNQLRISQYGHSFDVENGVYP
jgi:NAD+--asparagine ADP-ribosyltransferase